MLLSVFAASCRPLLATLHAWLYRGVLDDPHQEFFVQAAPGEAARKRTGACRGRRPGKARQGGVLQGGLAPPQHGNHTAASMPAHSVPMQPSTAPCMLPRRRRHPHGQPALLV